MTEESHLPYFNCPKTYLIGKSYLKAKISNSYSKSYFKVYNKSVKAETINSKETCRQALTFDHGDVVGAITHGQRDGALVPLDQVHHQRLGIFQGTRME